MDPSGYDQSPNRTRPAVDPSPHDFRSLYVSQSSFVFNTLRRFGVRSADLEDQLHEVFVRVHARLEDFNPERPVRPWLSGFAFRVASEYRRRASHRREVFPDQPPEQVDPDQPDRKVEQQRARRMVMMALERLPFERRAVFVLHELEGFTMPEIAEALSAPLNTAYSRLRLARRDFRTAVRQLRQQRGAA